MASGRKGGTPKPSASMPVEVDPNFVRLVADQVLVMHLGRDIDLAFLTIGPKLMRIQRGGDDHDLMRMNPQLNEVARLRITPAGAGAMAMEILTAMIRTGAINKSEMIGALSAVESDDPSEADAELDPEAHHGD